MLFSKLFPFLILSGNFKITLSWFLMLSVDTFFSIVGLSAPFLCSDFLFPSYKNTLCKDLWAVWVQVPCLSCSLWSPQYLVQCLSDNKHFLLDQTSLAPLSPLLHKVSALVSSLPCPAPLLGLHSPLKSRIPLHQLRENPPPLISDQIPYHPQPPSPSW